MFAEGIYYNLNEKEIDNNICIQFHLYANTMHIQKRLEEWIKNIMVGQSIVLLQCKFSSRIMLLLKCNKLLYMGAGVAAHPWW